MRLALYQPDIPQNTGTLLRLGAALDVPVDLIEPAGFILDDKRLGRALMDYGRLVDLTRHRDWQAFEEARTGRLLLLTTKAETHFTDFTFHADDILLLGSESAGVPPSVHDAADHRLTIPMRAEARSLNVAVAGAMVLSEALRQTRWHR